MMARELPPAQVLNSIRSQRTGGDRSVDNLDRNLPAHLARTEVILSATSPEVRARISHAIETFTPTAFTGLRPDQSVAAGLRGPHIPIVAVAIAER